MVKRVSLLIGFDSVLDQPNMLMAWVAGEAARVMESLHDSVIAQKLGRLLEKITGEDIPKLKSIEVTRWHQHPYQLGVYSYRSPETDRNGLGPEDLAKPVFGGGEFKEESYPINILAV